MGFATKWKTKKICVKEWSKKHIFLSHFFIFHHKPKRMLKFLRNGFWIVIVQKIRKKGLSHLVKMHFSVSGHVTLEVVRWRHELDYFCPQWVYSKFGPIEAYLCRVIASWFFPSNGIKRYFNGPLMLSELRLWTKHTLEQRLAASVTQLIITPALKGQYYWRSSSQHPPANPKGRLKTRER